MQGQDRKTIIIDVNGKGASATIKELSAASRKLRSDLVNLDPQSKQFKEGAAQLQGYNARMNELTKHLRNGAGAWDRFKTSVESTMVGVVGSYALFNTIEAITNGVTSSIEAMTSKADELSNIKKTTQLTDAQMVELQKRLSNIDTRTGQKELRMLAYEAGKMGKNTVDSVAEFVEQMNIVQVALGAELGEGATTAISKASKQFNEGVLNIASGINAIGAASEAQEGYLVDFIARLAPLAQTAGLAAGDVLGFAATLDQAGLHVEMSATALNSFFIDFVKNTDEFGQMAGFAKGELKALADEKGYNEALLAMLANMKKLNPEADGFLNVMGQMGIDGNRGAQVFLEIANSLDEVRKQQALANEEVRKGTSVGEEYNEMNNNLAGRSLQAGKTIQAFFKQMREFVGGTAIGFKIWLAENLGMLWSLTKILLGGAAAWVTYKIAVLLSEKAHITFFQAMMKTSTMLKVQQMATYAAAAAQALLAGNIGRAKAAMYAFNVVAKLNPIGLLVTAVAALTAGLILLGKKMYEMGKTTEALKPFRAFIDSIRSAFADLSLETRKFYAETLKPLVDFTRNVAVKVYEHFFGSLGDGSVALAFLGRAFQSILMPIKNTLTGLAAFFRFINVAFAAGKLASVEWANTFIDAFNRIIDSDIFEYFSELSGIKVEPIRLIDTAQLERDVKRAKEILKVPATGESKDSAIDVINNASSGGSNPSAAPGGGTPKRKKEAEDELKWQKETMQALMKEREKLAEEMRKHQDAWDNANLDRLADMVDEESEAMEQVRKEAQLHWQLMLDISEEGSMDAMDARLALLELEMAEELKAVGDNEHLKQLIRQKYAQEAADLTKDMAEEDRNRRDQEQLEDLEIASSHVQQLSDLINMGLDNELARIDIAKNEDMAALDERLAKKLITEEQYAAEKAKLEDKYRKEERAIKKQQFMANKAAAIIQGIIDTASAVIKAAPNIPLQVAAGILGAAQIAMIARQPVPEYGRGGLLDGPSHAMGGVTLNAEGGESIINKKSTAMYGPLLSAINEAGGGKRFSSHARMPRFDTGGVVQAQQSGGGAGYDTAARQMMLAAQEMRQALGNIKAKAYITYQQMRDYAEDEQLIEDASRF
jgi:TP901 family phage tail tape measure protein